METLLTHIYAETVGRIPGPKNDKRKKKKLKINYKLSHHQQANTTALHPRKYDRAAQAH